MFSLWACHPSVQEVTFHFCFPFPGRSCSAHVPPPKVSRWVSTLCIHLSSPRATLGWGQRELPPVEWDGAFVEVSCSLTTTIQCWEGFLGADCSGAVECEMRGEAAPAQPRRKR